MFCDNGTKKHPKIYGFASLEAAARAFDLLTIKRALEKGRSVQGVLNAGSVRGVVLRGAARAPQPPAGAPRGGMFGTGGGTPNPAAIWFSWGWSCWCLRINRRPPPLLHAP